MHDRTKIKTLFCILFIFLIISYNHVVLAATLVVNNSPVFPNGAISVTVGDLSGDRDWVGIYHKNDSNAWDNVLSWNWVNNGTLSLPGIPDSGEYEARLFFHNSYNVEASVAFDISSASITSLQSSYSPNENIKVSLVGLSGDKDWVGVYRKGDSNEWSNMKSWAWANSDELTLTGISDTGEYEARLFFHRSYNTQASVEFNVTNYDDSTLVIQSSAVETIDDTSAYVFFNLNKKAQAQVEYGETANYDRTTSKETSFNYDAHRQLFSDLKVNTLYHYRVHTYDRQGVEVISNDKTFMIKHSDGLAYPSETQYTNIPTNDGVAKPEKGASVIDPEFGSTITRVTDSRVLDSSGRSCVSYQHPKTQSWNADMSLLRVKFRLYDANTLEESPITKGLTCDGAYYKLGSLSSTLRWSHKDPNVYYVLGNLANNTSRFVFRKHTINGNTITHEVIKNFSEYGFETMQLGSNEGSMDQNDRFAVFTAKKPNNDHVWGVFLDTGSNPVKVTVKELPNTSWGMISVKGSVLAYSVYDWLVISPKGNHILELKTVDGPSFVGKGEQETYPDTEVIMYDLNFENPKPISDFGSHGDIGIDSNGNQVWVQFEYGERSGTWSYNLDTLEDTLQGKSLLPNNHGHISCQNYNRPGWCYLSTTLEGQREVYALKLDGSGKVNRFAQTRYQYSPLGGVSPDGKRVIFYSNWNDGVKDIYHAVLKTGDGELNTKVVQEDAQNDNTDGWRVYDQSPAGATITNIYDGDKGSRVIQLQGSSTENGYQLGGNWKNNQRKSIQWRMKYDEQYIIYISVNTTKGRRYIQYNASNENDGLNGEYIHHGLGSFTTDGTWRVFTRDLDADLKAYEHDNTVLSIDSFFIRGSGLLDDIHLLQ